VVRIVAETVLVPPEVEGELGDEVVEFVWVLPIEGLRGSCLGALVQPCQCGLHGPRKAAIGPREAREESNHRVRIWNLLLDSTELRSLWSRRDLGLNVLCCAHAGGIWSNPKGEGR
jgi:hypothetical protein